MVTALRRRTASPPPPTVEARDDAAVHA